MPTRVPIARNLAPRIERSSDLIGRRRKPYRATDGLLDAVNVALTLERPLLLTGEAGCGKTDFAWAAASALARAQGDTVSDREPLACYVRSDTRARDLLYTHDMVTRFGDAQHGGSQGLARARDPRNYIHLQPLGRALASPRRRVVLIDEIDKAPRDLPNDLLRELDHAAFEILEIPDDLALDDQVTSHGIPLRRVMQRPVDEHGRRLLAPLVIVTSNVERQLPDAFLRRCIFWHIEFPTNELTDILADHFADDPRVDEGFLDKIVVVFRHVRETPGLLKKPATAELIDWVGALLTVFEREPMRHQINDLGAALASGRRDVMWRGLPGLACLVKLREDQDTLCRT